MYDIYQQSALGVKKCKVNNYIERKPILPSKALLVAEEP